MKTFKRIYIEITNCCNLTCSFCPETKRPQKFMAYEEFEEVINKIDGHGSYVYFHIKGEPTLHPDLSKMLLLCYEKGLKVNLTTNGTTIDQVSDILLSSKALRQISFSLQSQENLDHHKDMKAYLDPIMAMVNKGRIETDIIFELRLWNYEKDINGHNQGSMNAKALDEITSALEVDKDIFETIQKGKGIKILPQVYLSKNLVFQWPDMSLDVINETGTCYGLRQQIGILVNGDVVPCCLDCEGDTVLGNIFEENFESIVTSERAMTMVKGFEECKIVEPLCQRCGYRSRFD